VAIWIGISGWTYPPWRGNFYPPGLPHREELRYVAEHMNSVEINGSFYSLQRRSSFETWAASVPEDFVFAVKGGRFTTHMKKLSGNETPLANFFASGVLALDQSWVRSCGSFHPISASTRIGWTRSLDNCRVRVDRRPRSPPAMINAFLMIMR
jgi:Protein of unknown function DUF72